jgi:potassium-transporting ATPase KdpC subunit
MRRILTSLRPHAAALRLLIVLTIVVGVIYTMAVTAVAQIPGLKTRAEGSLVKSGDHVVGSELIGQSYLDKDGNPLVQYLQGRPSAAGDGYDPTASSASNLGPESIVDGENPSLLTQVCTRSLEIGKLDGVDGSRPFCTSDGVGAVLAVFHAGPGYAGAVTRVVSLDQACPTIPFLATYQGVRVECARPGEDYSTGKVVPVRGDAPAHPAVPADAVTASGSGLDPEISPAYARIQINRIAKARGITAAQVQAVIDRYSKGRDLGFLGEPRVNVLQVNLALDRNYPYSKT